MLSLSSNVADVFANFEEHSVRGSGSYESCVPWPHITSYMRQISIMLRLNSNVNEYMACIAKESVYIMSYSCQRSGIHLTPKWLIEYVAHSSRMAITFLKHHPSLLTNKELTSSLVSRP